MLTVPLHGRIANGRVALISDEDEGLVAAYRWHASERSRTSRLKLTYAVARPGDGIHNLIYMHRLISGGRRVDHIDHDGLNNQRSNLREATQAQNNANHRLRSDSTSGFKGVSWDRDRRLWKAYIVVAGVQRYLGRFPDELSAARAYDAAALDIYGEYAWLNFQCGG